jgi:hypothetical protein
MKKGYCNLWFISLLLCSSSIVVCSEKEHDLVKEELYEKIAQQRKIIKDRQKQQWLWNMAKIVGPLGLMAFTAYQLFKPASNIIIEQPTQSVIDVPSFTTNLLEPSQLIQQDFQVAEQKLFTPVEQQKKQPLTKEEVLKYKQASHAYGAGAAYFSIASFLFGKFYYPYAAANFMVSLYYGIKSLQLPLKPVVLKDITIIPDELPY